MKIMMDEKETRRMAVIEQTLEGKFKNQQAADLLHLSIRQVKRLKMKVRNGGATAILHGNRGRKPHNAIPESMEIKIMEFAEGELKGYNFTHMKEVIEEISGITITYSSFRRILKRHGIKSPKGGRRRKKHRSREAKAHLGELVQLDASRYDWFGDGSYAHLHGAIDDATNQVVGLYFTKEETMEGYSELVFQINRTHGLPHAFYADGRTIFFYDSKTKKKRTIEEQMAGMKERQPQFARACNEVGITLKQAHSPQAKGLIECLWSSLQDRLPKDFIRLGIHTMEEANTCLPDFMTKWNCQHSHAPKEQESFLSPKLPEKTLPISFARHEQRIFTNGYTFSFGGKKYIVPDKTFPASPGDVLTVVSGKSIVRFRLSTKINSMMLKSSLEFFLRKESP